MVHSILKHYAKHSQQRQWPPRTLTKEDAEAVIDSTVDEAEGILVRHLCKFYVDAWEAYCSIPYAKENPATNDKIHALCSTVFEEVKQRVSRRITTYLVQRVLVCGDNEIERVC